MMAWIAFNDEVINFETVAAIEKRWVDGLFVVRIVYKKIGTFKEYSFHSKSERDIEFERVALLLCRSNG